MLNAHNPGHSSELQLSQETRMSLTQSPEIAIVGCGLMGLTIACKLVAQGRKVKLFESDRVGQHTGSSYTAAGMLAPYSEMEHSHRLIFSLGYDSIDQWRSLIDTLDQDLFIGKPGSLIVANRQDQALLKHFIERLSIKLADFGCDKNSVQYLGAQQMSKLAPNLSERFSSGLYLPEEGNLDNRQILVAMEEYLNKYQIQILRSAEAQIKAHTVQTCHGIENFPLVIDCRGLGARESIPLRGVRGELLVIKAPQVSIGQMVRVLHPQHPIYVVPRPESIYLIGATAVESDDQRSITVKSALELLSTAYCVDSSFAEAEILEARVNRRPALPDNLPAVYCQPGLIRLNGLYRHGFLIAPKLAQLVSSYIDSGKDSIDKVFQSIFKEEVKRCA